MVSRRAFLDTLAVGAAGLAISSTAKSYGQIIGSNDRLNFAIIGLRWRGYAHLAALKANKDAAHVSHVCDVDSNNLTKFAGVAEHELGYAPASDKDFRHVLQQRDVDAVTIATPDHWHAPLRSLPCRRASTSMLKSHAPIILPRERCWCRLNRSIKSLCSRAHSSDRAHILSRPSTRYTTV
jgi:hypothetical protein